MFLSSIRWRLQLWLAFLLVAVLAGFGVTVYNLYRVIQLNQLDEELKRRVAVVSSALRGGPSSPSRAPRQAPPDEPGPRNHAGSSGDPPPDDFRGPPPGGEPGSPGSLQVRLAPEVQSLFDEEHTNGFYFVIWSWDGSVLKTSSNAPGSVPSAERLSSKDTRTYVRSRGALREAYHYTE